MSFGIFGAVRRDGAPITSAVTDTLQAHFAGWGQDRLDAWREGSAVLGRALTYSTPDAMNEACPGRGVSDDFAFCVAARLDNRQDLLRELLPCHPLGAREVIADGELLRIAYRRWGTDAPRRALGDWSFAAWHPDERRLVLARDPYGLARIFYHAGRDGVGFACIPQAVRSLRLTKPQVDELALARLLVTWPAGTGGDTVDAGVKSLPPAHLLEVTDAGIARRRYWRMAVDRPTFAQLRTRGEYAEGLRGHLDDAVGVRMRVHGGLGVTLSGGLDSGSVATSVAAQITECDRAIPAFVSVPCQDTASYTGKRFGDELPYARATAERAGLELVSCNAAQITPVGAIRHALSVTGEPTMAAGNLYWMIDMLRVAGERGCRALLTGQMGNAGLSWTGQMTSLSPVAAARHLGVRDALWGKLRWHVPQAIRRARNRPPAGVYPYATAAILPEFADRLRLFERQLDDPDNFARSPLDVRLQILKPAALSLSWSALAAEWGVDVRDPTMDVRLLNFSLAVPDRMHIDPASGLDRWLIRAATADRLPDEVRLNRRRGRQAGDLVPRLRSSADEVEQALDELGNGPAAAYLDVSRMRAAWARIRTEDSPAALRLAITMLTRGVMAGVFVNELLGT